MELLLMYLHDMGNSLQTGITLLIFVLFIATIVQSACECKWAKWTFIISCILIILCAMIPHPETCLKLLTALKDS